MSVIEVSARVTDRLSDGLPAVTDPFERRHIGPDGAEIQQMLEVTGFGSLDELVDATVPAPIRLRRTLAIGPGGRGLGETEAIATLRDMASRNRVFRSCIGMGYSDCVTPAVIQRNILENPGWYTQYTPYQAEIAQGRLEALLNFQTMVCDLTGMEIAGASLLDESTAAAEAMAMCFAIGRQKRARFCVADHCHPQTIGVMRTRAESMGINLDVCSLDSIDLGDDVCGVLVQYPATDGVVQDFGAFADRVHIGGAMLVVAADLLSLTLLRPPGEFGADITVGSAQRFGVPMGCGGPHAGFLATSEKHVRRMPGRIIGISKDRHGRPAYRTAIQTREQHIKRERATSNICTAQALLAIMASMYGVYHGPERLRQIAMRVHNATRMLAAGLRRLGHDVGDDAFFDTLRVRLADGVGSAMIVACAADRMINVRAYDDGSVGVSLDETVDAGLINDLLWAFAGGREPGFATADLSGECVDAIEGGFARESGYLTHDVFNTHHSETEMLRYLFRLQGRDLSLAHSMIPLGSCTMKLNATTEMLPVTWPEFSRIHPFAPAEQCEGYAALFAELESWLGEITGLPAVSLQPNAGSQGEYAGLMAIRAYHDGRGESRRDVCLIPTSAHGTNPASAVIAGFRVVPVGCDKHGNVNVDDLRALAEKHADELGALMITYPSTHGVFEPEVQEICKIIHDVGGQVYLDGANMNAQVGVCRPGEIGADVCHLNLHKTFCIPHGGGGPGMGPICAADHLAPFMPGHPVSAPAGTGTSAIGPIAGAPYGSPSILPISWAYIAMMGGEGLTRATGVAILNANYMAKRLSGHYEILFTGVGGNVAHEFIIDCRGFEKSAGIRIDDIAKRLVDYGFHAPTMSWPVAGTLMIEPTESESKCELDRFCDAMISIRDEIRAVEEGRSDREDNALKNAPHTAEEIASDAWSHPYSRESAAFPAPWVRECKFWPAVARVDNAWGDRNLVCTCVGWGSDGTS